MKGEDYQELAMRTKGEYESEIDQLICASLGLCGEAGEFAEIIKKGIYQGHGVQVDVLVEELGDVLWYIALACDAIGYDIETVMFENIEKLKLRYPEGFQVERSLKRIK